LNFDDPIFNENRFMRMSTFKKIIICAFALVTAITACVKNSSTPVLDANTSTIAHIVQHGSNLTILDSALSKSGLLQTLDSVNSVAAPFTLFAPLDIAFTNAGIADSTINKFSADSLRRFLGYYIYSGAALKIADLPKGPNAPLQMIFGDTVFVTVTGTDAYINGNLISQSDVFATNGIMQALAGITIPPSGNIFETLSVLSQTTDTTLTYFVAALHRASTGAIDLVTLLNTGGIFTIFAPTNAAFRLTPYSTEDIINNTDADSLARILQTHILTGRVFSSDFATDSVRLSYVGDSLAIRTTFRYTVQSKGDSIPASVHTVNILAKNGLIHETDRVLFP
jgi:uncharacterized surface protein with fasciclin (FAS1) repeats